MKQSWPKVVVKIILRYLLILSIIVNVILGYRWYKRIQKWDETAALHEVKKISYSDGLEVFKKKLKSMPEIDPYKYMVIYLWDSTMYDFMLEDAMKGFDSLAHTVGRKRINFIFVTEMADSEAKEYLKRKGFIPTTFSVAGDMDDFVSGIFNEKPSKIKMVNLNNKSKSSNPSNGMPKFKSKPMYLILDPGGKIIFYDNRYIWPKTDTAFIRILDLLNHGEKILN